MTVGQLEGEPVDSGMAEHEFEYWKALHRIRAEEAAMRPK